jgi:hypothetical protein
MMKIKRDRNKRTKIINNQHKLNKEHKMYNRNKNKKRQIQIKIKIKIFNMIKVVGSTMQMIKTKINNKVNMTKAKGVMLEKIEGI